MLVQKDNFTLRATSKGRGPYVLVIGSATYYPRTFSHALFDYYTFVFCDTRGFAANNDSQNAGDVTQKQIIDDVDLFFQQLQTGSVIVVGHSIHSFIALSYAKKFPEKVSRLILIATSPLVGTALHDHANQYFTQTACQERKKALADNLCGLQNNCSLIDRMLIFGPMLWKDYSFDARTLWEDVTINQIAGPIIWGPLFNDFPTQQTLDNIKCPIMLILGKYDYFNPFYLWDEYIQKYENLTVTIFQSSGHTPQYEQADLFNKTLIQWLETTKDKISETMF